ncbi:hypothetical protein Hanom_Chr05g00443001 [Helianthus anomalus]
MPSSLISTSSLKVAGLYTGNDLLLLFLSRHRHYQVAAPNLSLSFSPLTNPFFTARKSLKPPP